MSSLHISISAEPVAHISSFAVTNSILTSLLVSALLIGFAVVAGSSIHSKGKPSRFQALVELMVDGFRTLVHDITGSDRKVEKFTPIIMAFFLFILINNWFGLLPGVGTIGFTEGKEPTVRVVQPAKASETAEQAKGEQASSAAESRSSEKREEGPKFVPYLRAGTADLNMTIALALISVALTQVYGFSAQRFAYFLKFINFSNPMNFAVGLLETVLEFAKIMSFAFRLFGNVFAGEVLLAVMMFLVPLVVPMPFYGLEIFVGFIQALVFSMLSLVFFNMATIGHHDEH